MEPLVSVIIPVYNVEKYVKRCLESVINQTYTNLEIIVVNDGATDNSAFVVKAIHDERIRYFEKENGGQATARNFGLDVATGDYIVMIDSDDYVSESLVETCLNTVEKTKADLVLFTSYNVNQEGKMQYIKRDKGIKVLDAGPTPWNKFYQANLWEGCRFPVGYWYEDLGIIPVVTLKAENPVKIQDALYYYITDRADSQSNIQQMDHFLDVVVMLENIENELEKLGIYEESKEQLAYLYIEHLIYRLVLRKAIYISDKKDRKALIKKISAIIEQKFPDWGSYPYQAGGKLTATLKKKALWLYLHHFYLLGDLVWKYPFSIRSKQTGF
ncbi:glycosyltransferase [Listeria seeligeri]|uniref:glycosyltransferase family 2 protein n=1 Tax=Listeria seeligeri TaxID=1640 RepID=UPI001625ADDA|nr:glycosyltransferase family 2 protein [Listeria seeligeri]MBC1757063.1 glycosyltransferase [Listeria seeligeri]MBC1814721.1 glycosyltransferase [Listeria seeligeri]MBC2029061.1 glycosyltransferase [Listeria seeligeri]MBC6114463.1 glycosyltransferase [Listeria seeligeri]MBC6159166.1 glycosyltransferase [Listeria seeligeri]